MILQHVCKIFCVGFLLASAAFGANVDLGQAGAHGDGVTLNTAIIQRAIDACSAGGGGTVRLPAGRYLTGTIRLKDHVTLHLDANAVLLGSTDLKDYPSIQVPFPTVNDAFFRHALVYAEGARHIAIEGQGCIDGQGASEGLKRRSDKAPERYMNRPSVVRFVECTGVRLSGIEIRDSAFWVTHLLACTDAVIDGVKVESRTANYNNDGFDIDCCENVRIANCSVNSEDDALCLKAGGDRPCRNIAVTNCLFSSHCSGIRFGCEAVGTFSDITISNCVIYDTRATALQLQTFDGGNLERVCISGIAMRNVGQALLLNVGYQLYTIGIPESELPVKRKGAPGHARDIIIRDIQADGVGRCNQPGPGGTPAPIERKLPCVVSGMPESPIEGLSLENIRLRMVGGGTAEEAATDLSAVPNKFNGDGMGVPPAYAFYARHVKNLRLRDFDVAYEKADLRPAFRLEQSSGIDASGLRGMAHADASALVALRDVQDVTVHGCQPEPLDTFVFAEGAGTRNIQIAGNHLTSVKRPVVSGPGLGKGAVILDGKRIRVR